MSACTKYIRQQTKESQITDFMMAKHLRLLLILLLGAVTSCKTTQQIPQQPTGKEAKREFRGAWIQTAFQGEYKLSLIHISFPVKGTNNERQTSV